MLKTIFTLFLFTFVVNSTASYANEKTETKVIAALFHANWCSSCKVLDPKIKKVKAASQLDSQSILFVTLDLTSDSTRHQAKLMSQALNISKVYDKYGDKTGFMLLIDPKTQEIKSMITKRMDNKDIAAAFAKTLKELS